MPDAPQNRHVVWSQSLVDPADRAALLGQTGCVVWITGLSGSGKSTIARQLEARLIQEHRFAYVLDGDNIRHGLCGDLGFSPAERSENIRRIGEVANLFADAGAIVITAFISPYRADRDQARAVCTPNPLIEVYLDTPLSTCEARDPKGLYAKARRGEIQDFTGIDAPYEAPMAPEIRLDTSHNQPADCAEIIIDHMHSHGILINSNSQSKGEH